MSARTWCSTLQTDKEEQTDKGVLLQVFAEDVAKGVLDKLQVGREYVWTGLVTGYRQKRHLWLQAQSAEGRATCLAHLADQRIFQFTQGSSFQDTETERIMSVCTERYHPITSRACVLCQASYLGGRQLLCLHCTCSVMRDPSGYAAHVVALVTSAAHAPELATQSDLAAAIVTRISQDKVAAEAVSTADPASLLLYERLVAPFINGQGFCDKQQTAVALALIACLTSLHASQRALKKEELHSLLVHCFYS
jgi:hypothetical protein